MAQGVKVLAPKPRGLSSIPRTYLMEAGNQLTQDVL